uniref:peroxidase n=1 Tax=Oryza meridionalis TaxID=40149 RepID=A0A0E0E2E3_9ORYZ
MAFRCKGGVASVALLVAVAALASAAQGFPNPFGHEEFTDSYYDDTCPNAQSIVRSVMERHAAANPRTAPAILRLFFHDCFVNGCDASILLNATDSMESEKDAEPNATLAGFDVIDGIKSELERSCPATVSCADVLALAARDAVAMLGGPSWGVLLGRKDSVTASIDMAKEDLPNPKDSLAELIRMFEINGLDERDLTALSGAHTVGMAHDCKNYEDRIYSRVGQGGDSIDPSFAAQRRQECEQKHGEAMAPFDERTPTKFDNAYYVNLLARRGLLTSDQELYTQGCETGDLVKTYAMNGDVFYADFVRAMVKMGNIRPKHWWAPAEVRLKCKGGVASVALLVAVAALASAAQGFPNPFGHEEFKESYYDETGGVASVALLVAVAALASAAQGFPNPFGHEEFKESYYDETCPNAQSIVRSVMERHAAADPRTAPAILRLFFHDCFVNGCDASILLNATDSMDSEKDAEPNASVAGYGVIDDIKSELERSCPATVSCADVLALAARDAVAMLGGPSWGVLLGRKDSLVASMDMVKENLPSPTDSLAELIRMFKEHDLDERDLTALSGAHTVGRTHSCKHYEERIYSLVGQGGDSIDPSFAAQRRQECEQNHGNATAPFDERTPAKFDNAYYVDLLARRGLLTSDQELYTQGCETGDLVKTYAMNGDVFFADFARAMVKMGNMRPKHWWTPAEVRLKCSVANTHY